MVSRSTLINFCATLLCTGSVAAAQSQSSGSNRSASYLRQPPRVSDSHNSSSSSSSSDNNGTPRSVESSMTPSELAEFASSIAAYSAAYKQAIIDDKAESQQPAEAKNNINIDSDKNKNIESVLLLNEDFCSTNNNVFTADNNSNNNDTQHHCSTTTIHGRNGVIQLSPNSKKSNSHHHHHSTITTPNLLLPPSSSSYSKLIITFSYQTTQMTHGDKFCLDLSTDNGRSWHDDECYVFGVDFENGFWYDGVGVEFELEDVLKEEEEEEDSALSVRWIVDSGGSDGDVLLDWVKVVAY